MNLGMPAERKPSVGWFVWVIPSFSAEHQQEKGTPTEGSEDEQNALDPPICQSELTDPGVQRANAMMHPLLGDSLFQGLELLSSFMIT